MGLEKMLSNDIETKFKNFADSFGTKVSDSAMSVMKNVLLTYVLNRFGSLAKTPLNTAINKLTGTVNIPGVPAPNNSAASGTTGQAPAASTGAVGEIQRLINGLPQNQQNELRELGLVSGAALETFASQLFGDFVNVSQMKTFFTAGFGQNVTCLLYTSPSPRDS